MVSSDLNENIVDSNELSALDKNGAPIPVTIPISLAPNVRVIYTTRLGGVSVGDAASCNYGTQAHDTREAIHANRAALAREIGANLSLAHQVHSSTVQVIDDSFEANTEYGFDATGFVEGTVLDADAQVTKKKSVALGMFAADCLPVLLADPEAGVIAAAHAGRMGLMRGVIEETLDSMLAQGAHASRIVATLGPAICGDCYEVGGDLADEFDARFVGSFTLTRFGGPGIDISGAARAVLLAHGISEKHIIDSRPRVAAATQYLGEDAELAEICASDGEGPADLNERMSQVRHSMCTLENPLLYSHRRASLAGKQGEGRLLALIVQD